MLRLKRIPFNFTMIIGIILLFTLIQFIKWILSFTIVHWILIGYAFFGIYLLKRYFISKKVQREIEERRLNLKRQKNLSDLKRMDWFAFESFVCDLFIELGYETLLTKKTKDRGKDIMIYKEDFFAVVECKRFNETLVTRP